MERSKKLIIFLFLLIVSLTFVRIAVSNKISTNGAVLGKLQDQISDYQTKNILLKEKISNLSSLYNVSSEAGKMGFITSKNGFVVKTGLPIAAKQ